MREPSLAGLHFECRVRFAEYIRDGFAKALQINVRNVLRKQ
jgi:hypothetical protein